MQPVRLTKCLLVRLEKQISKRSCEMFSQASEEVDVALEQINKSDLLVSVDREARILRLTFNNSSSLTSPPVRRTDIN